MKQSKAYWFAIAIALVLSSCGEGSSSSLFSDSSLASSDSSSASSSSTDETPKTSAIKLSSPAAGSSLTIADSVLTNYLASSSIEEEISFLESGKSTDATCQSVMLKWEKNGSAYYIVSLSRDPSYSEATTIKVSGLTPYYEAYNLIPNQTYYWKVKGSKTEDESASSSFYTVGPSVRFIKASGAYNIRDLGGWSVGEGSSIAYGKIYRGGQLNGYNGGAILNEDGIGTFNDVLGIKTEIDLRKVDSDNGGQTSNFFSPEGRYLQAPLGQYDRILDPDSYALSYGYADWSALLSGDYNTAWGCNGTSQDSLLSIFSVLADEKNYPVYIHCNAGADRTGTLAFLIEGLLGVGYDDLVRDFELTSFSTYGPRYRSALSADKTSFDDTGVYQNSNGNYVAFGRLYKGIMDYYGQDGGSFAAAVENYLTSYVGVTASTIESVKANLLDSYEAPIVSSSSQEWVLTDRTASLSVEGLDSVTSLSLDGIDLGSNPSSIDLSKLSGLAGEKDVKAVGTKNGVAAVVYCPVTIISQEITTAKELLAAVAYQGGESIYGYYRLSNDLGSLDDPIALASGYKSGIGNDYFSENGAVGFRGTLDGNGHKIIGSSGYAGLFEVIGGGALIKDLDVVDTAYSGVSVNCVLASSMDGATFENVSFALADSATGSETTAKATGWLVANGCSQNHFKNVSIAATQPLPSIFGGTWIGYAGNHFEDCTLEVGKLGYLALSDSTEQPIYPYEISGLSGHSSKDAVLKNSLTIGQEEAEIDLGSAYENMEITAVKHGDATIDDFVYEDHVLAFPIAGLFTNADVGETSLIISLKTSTGFSVYLTVPVTVISSYQKISLSETQELLLTSETKSLALGDYASYAIQSMKLGDYDLGQNASDLTISSDLVADTQSHGSGNIIILATNGGSDYEISVPVLLITREISTLADFTTYCTASKYASVSVVYGYYRLSADLGSSSDAFTCYTSAVDGWGDESALGFRGTLDGNGHSISGKSSGGAFGLFAVIGNGARLQDVSFKDYGYDPTGWARHVLAEKIYGSTFENVSFSLLGGGGSGVGSDIGWISGIGIENTSMKNVTFSAAGYDLPTIFGNNCGAKLGCSFEGCSLTCKSLVALGRNGDSEAYQYKTADGLAITNK